MSRPAKDAFGWAGAVFGLSGVAFQALMPGLLRYSFFAFLFAAAFWIVNGVRTRNRPLVFTQGIYLCLNTIVIVRQFL